MNFASSVTLFGISGRQPTQGGGTEQVVCGRSAQHRRTFSLYDSISIEPLRNLFLT